MFSNPLIIPILGLSIPIVAILCGSLTKVLKMRHEERMARGAMSEEDAEHYAKSLQRLETRLRTLESILDDEVPGWRRKYDD